MHRSIDGGQTWEGPAFVSSTATDMSLVLTPPIPAVRFGPWQDLAADGRSLYYVWVDGRNGDLDIYSRTIDRMMQITSVTPSTTSAYPNDVVHLQVGVQNLDDLWGWNLVLQAASSTPYWWNLEQSSGALGPSASATFDYAYTVPDTAAPEDVEVDVILRPSWQGGAYSVFPTTLHVLSLVGVEGEEARLDLPPVSPNPARRLANVTFSLSRRGIARLAVYDVAGRCVRVLQEGDLGAGRHARSWDGRDASGSPVASGAYLVRLEAEGRLLTKRMVWIR